jgi:hypothetical protein
MSGIQSLLAIGAVLLFGLVSLRFNSAVIQNISLEVQNKVYLTAFSLADDVIEEIKQKAFDECTADGKLKVVALSSLTDPALLGKESGENWPDFNDIDDYNKVLMFLQPLDMQIQLISVIPLTQADLFSKELM